MSRRRYPAILLAVLSVPGAVWALGLGDIRVDSALNEPLNAQIAIVGANDADLATLSARVADADAFQRLGADRPPYLSTVQFSVGADPKGQPVLKVRSTAPFADPVVSLLVDLRWSGGELIREFSLLLDPAAFALPASSTPVASATPVESASAVSPIARVGLPTRAELAALVRPEADSALSFHPVETAAAPVPTRHGVWATAPVASPYRVRRGDTLWRIVRRAGARSEADRQRLMAAVFQANPEAFDGNINLLHADALLTLPPDADTRLLISRRRLPARDAPAADPGDAASAQVLTNRVQSLEAALQAVRQQLVVTGAAVDALRQQAEVSQQAAVPAAVPAAVAPAATGQRLGLAGSLAGGLGILLAGVLFLARRRAAPADAPEAQPPAAPAGPAIPDETAASAAAGAEAAGGAPQQDRSPVVEGIADIGRSPPAPPATAKDPMKEDTMLLGQADFNKTGATVQMQGDAVSDTATLEGAAADTVAMEGIEDDAAILDILKKGPEVRLVQSTVLDYNLVDLDSSAQHVHLPSDLNDRPVVTERRVSIVDALQTAITRDPNRHDLRMKLLETYYATALANRRAFVDFARLQAREPGNLLARDWEKIFAMGREIAPHDEMFNDKQDGDLADCA